jgi:hypothetical protein
MAEMKLLLKLGRFYVDRGMGITMIQDNINVQERRSCADC